MLVIYLSPHYVCRRRAQLNPRKTAGLDGASGGVRQRPLKRGRQKERRKKKRTHCNSCDEPRCHMFMMPFGSNSFSPLHGQFEPSLFIGPLSLSWLGKGTGFCIRVCPLACTTREATKTFQEKKAMFVCCGIKCTLLPVRPLFETLGSWICLRIYQVAKRENCVE